MAPLSSSDVPPPNDDVEYLVSVIQVAAATGEKNSTIESTFEKLFLVVFKMVYQVVTDEFRLEANKAQYVALDITEDILLNKLGKYSRQGKGSFMGWAYVCTKRAMLDYGRKQQREQARSGDIDSFEDLPAPHVEEYQLPEITTLEEFQIKLNRIGLSSLEAEVTVQIVWYELSPEETAEKLDYPIQKVYNAWARAKDKLRGFYGPQL